MNRDHLQAMQLLGVEAEELNGVLDEVQHALFVDHVELGCVYTNRTSLEMFEMSWEEFQGFGWAQRVHPSDMETLREAIERYERTKDSIDVRYRIRQNDGSLRAMHVNGKMVLDADGNQLGSVMMGRDVTTERALQERVIQGQKLEAVGWRVGWPTTSTNYFPDGRGNQLAVSARQQQPHLMVVFMCGYAGPDFHLAELGLPHTTFLQKPSHPNRLVAALGEVIQKTVRSVG